MDACCQGLKGRQTAYAYKKYRGHRVIPETIWKNLDDDNILLYNRSKSSISSEVA